MRIIVLEGGHSETEGFNKVIRKNGWSLIRHGSGHDIYCKNEKQKTIPRHKEIAEQLAKTIIKRQGLK